MATPVREFSFGSLPCPSCTKKELDKNNGVSDYSPLHVIYLSAELYIQLARVITKCRAIIISRTLLRESVRFETIADFTRLRVATQGRTNQDGLGIPSLIRSPMSERSECPGVFEGEQLWQLLRFLQMV
jgi:hypothetical protein